jgi:hypothetical protein
MTDQHIEPVTILLDRDERPGGRDPRVRRVALVIGIVFLAGVSLWLATSRHTTAPARHEGHPRVNAGGEHSFGVLADDSTFYYAVEVSATGSLRAPRISAASLIGIDDVQAALYTGLTPAQVANGEILPTPQPVSSVGPADFLVLITGRINCRNRPHTDQTPSTSVSYLDGAHRVPMHVNGMPVIEANLWQSACQP